MKFSTCIKLVLIFVYIPIAGVLWHIGEYASMVVLTISLSLVALRGGVTITFAPLRTRIVLALAMLVIAILLLGVD